MSLPSNRTEFGQFILRRLGDGAIKVNVTEQQLDDRISFAVRKAMDYHFDYTQVTYIATQVTAQIKSDKYITLPENIWGAVEMFQPTNTLLGGGIFAVDYQFVINNFQYWTTMSMQPYFIAMQNLKFIQDLLVGNQPVRFNRFTKKFNVDMNWDRVETGQYVVIKAYEVLDPETYPRIYQDIWLIEYTTAQVKQQWGENLQKYNDMPLPGGIKVNGAKIFDDASKEIARLEEELINSYSVPSTIFIG